MVRGVLAVGLLLALMLPGCGREAPAPGPQEDTVERVVSLSPSTTEILFALGVGEKVVGVTTACDYPPRVRDIRKVGDFARPNMETLIRLKPDLVIYTELLKRGLAEEIERRGMRTLQAEQRSFQEVFEAILKIGRATGAGERARALVARLTRRMEAVEARVAAVEPDERPRVFIEITADPLYTAGRGAFQHELVTRAGGVNIAGELDQSFLKISGEFVLRTNPDVILVAHMGVEEDAEAEIARRIGWGEVKAVREGGVITDIHPDLLCRPGPRLIDGLEALHRRLYPEGSTR